jgi:hypothetical protein
LQDNGLAKISQEGSATTARPITDQIFSALPQGSLLADQQKKHSDSYQHRNQNTDDKRHNPMPIHGRFRSSAFLRRSDAQPEEKFVHSVSAAALWRYAYDYGELAHSARAKSPNPGQGYLARRHHER